MLKQFICIVILCLPSLSFSQSKTIKDFYNKYKHQEEVGKLELKGFVLRLAAKFADEEDADRLLSRITRLRVLSFDNGRTVPRSELKEFMRSIRKERFEDLMSIREEGDDIQIMIREEGVSISDVLVIIKGDDKFTMLSLEGKLKFNDIKQLNIDVEGGDYFQRVPEKRAHEPSPRA